MSRRSLDVYKLLSDKYPDGFTWRDIEETLGFEHGSRNGAVYNYICYMKHNDLIVSIKKKHFPLFVRDNILSNNNFLVKTIVSMVVENLDVYFCQSLEGNIICSDSDRLIKDVGEALDPSIKK